MLRIQQRPLLLMLQLQLHTLLLLLLQQLLPVRRALLLLLPPRCLLALLLWTPHKQTLLLLCLLLLLLVYFLLLLLLLLLLLVEFYARLLECLLLHGQGRHLMLRLGILAQQAQLLRLLLLLLEQHDIALQQGQGLLWHLRGDAKGHARAVRSRHRSWIKYGQQLLLWLEY